MVFGTSLTSNLTQDKGQRRTIITVKCFAVAQVESDCGRFMFPWYYKTEPEWTYLFLLVLARMHIMGQLGGHAVSLTSSS